MKLANHEAASQRSRFSGFCDVTRAGVPQPAILDHAGVISLEVWFSDSHEVVPSAVIQTRRLPWSRPLKLATRLGHSPAPHSRTTRGARQGPLVRQDRSSAKIARAASQGARDTRTSRLLARQDRSRLRKMVKPWVELMRHLSAVQVDRVLDSMKGYKAYASQKTKYRCQLCPTNISGHKMWYRVMVCDSKICRSDCEWSVKILTCLEVYDVPTPATSTTRNTSFVYQPGQHDCLEASPPRKKMKREVERFVHARTSDGARPGRVHGELPSQFPSLPSTHLPKIGQVQRTSYHHRKVKLMQDAEVKHMNQLIEHNLFSDVLGGCVPIAFGNEVDVDGRANVGRGTDSNLTLVGLTTKTLLGRLRVANGNILHIDATFKLNQSGYPVVVFGASDKARTFHPVAVFITSQLQAFHYKNALTKVFEQYEKCFGSVPVISDVMTDADDALSNALDSVYEDRNECRPRHLMCLFSRHDECQEARAEFDEGGEEARQG